jgi:hypothetical protein
MAARTFFMGKLLFLYEIEGLLKSLPLVQTGTKKELLPPFLELSTF